MTYIPNLTGVTQGINPTTEVLASNGNQSLNVCINDPRSAFNEISVIQPLPLAQIDFVYGISTLVTTSNVQGSNATVTATTTANSSTTIVANASHARAPRSAASAPG